MTARRHARRFGLAARMMLVLLGATLLLGVAAVVTYGLLSEIRRDHEIIARQDLPRLSLAFRIANESARIAAKAPEFANVHTEDERARVRGDLDQLDVRLTLLIERMNAGAGDAEAKDDVADVAQTVIGWFAGREKHAHTATDADLRALDDLDWEMTATLDLLDELASARVALIEKLRRLAFATAHEGRRMNRRLAPLRDDLAFFLQTGWSDLDDIAPLPEGERASPALTAQAEAYSDVAVAATQVIAALTEAASAPSPDLLNPIRERYEAAMDRLARARADLEGADNVDILDRPIAGFARLGGPDGVFQTRQAYFGALDEQQRLLAEARRIAGNVALAADALVRNAEIAMRGASDHSGETVRLGVRILLGLTAFAALGAVLIGWIYIGRGVVGRIRTLSAAMQRMAKGDLETPAPVTGADEITDMSESLETFRQYAYDSQRLGVVEQMADELQEKNDALQDTLQKLEQAEAETRALARFPEENPNPVLRLSPDRTVLYANSAAYSAPGMTLPGMRANEDLSQAAAEAFVSGRPRQITFEAGDRAFLLTAAPVRGENYINVYGREITEERRAQAQVLAQEKMASLGQLTAGIAHEIKNPLNFVNNFAKLSTELLEDLQDEVNRAKENVEEDVREEIDAIVEDLTTNLTRISEHGRRADSIVRGMLDHSRKESGEAQTVEINKLVSEFVDLAFHGLRGQDRSFNSAIDKTFAEDAGEIECRAQDLSRVILNIANNAFQATHELKQKQGDAYQPVLEVTTTSLGPGGVEIRLKDNGPGMPEEVRAKIFEPFFTTKPTGQGTGLGLSMTHDIVVQMHGGALQVETAPGEGACFIIRLPRRMPSETAKDETA